MSAYTLVSRENLQVEKWESLVAQEEKYAFHSTLTFIDLFGGSFVFLIYEDYQGGMVLPVKSALGMQIVHTPFFYPFSSWMGVTPPFEEVHAFLTNSFRELNFLLDFPGSLDLPKKKFQVLDFQLGYGSQTKRSLKKAEQCAMRLANNPDVDKCAVFVVDSLLKKDVKLTKQDGESLKELILQLDKSGHLETLAVFDANTPVACLFFIRSDKDVYYLKGAADEKAMKNGALYFLMDQMIQRVKEAEDRLDFGGSNIESIRQFYLNLGGTDRFYYHLSESRLPFWYRILKSFRKTIVRK